MFNKIKNKLVNDKIIKIIFYSLISIFLIFAILNIELDNMDEIWNFSHARWIAFGLIPYRDMSIIVTPISMFLNSLFLRIDSSLLAFRILYWLYYIALICILDKLCDFVKIKKLIKYIFIFFVVFVLVGRCYLDYNFMQFILIMLLMYLSLKNVNYDKRPLNIIIPILSGIAILNKQSTGLVIAFIDIVLILFNKFRLKKEITYDFIGKRIGLMTVPVILFIVYLLGYGIFFDFYDLAVAGLRTFSNNYLDWQLLFSISVFYILMFILLIVNKKDYRLWVIFLYGLASLSVIIPIVDMVHVTLALIIPVLFLVLLASDRIRDFSSSYVYLLVPIFIFLIVNNIDSYIKADKIGSGVYKYIPVSYGLKEKIKLVSDYISVDNSAYILDYSSTVFDLNVGRYNKYFDLFMNGNFGIKGMNEVFSIIDSGEHKFLISNTNDNWQTPINIINHVKENYHNCGHVANFDVYCK